MNRKKLYAPFLLAVSLLFNSAHASAQQGFSDDLWQQALEGSHRSAKNILRNNFRHPRETLQFLELEPGDTVVELWPGGGWYTEVLAPLLKGNGKLHVAHFYEESTVGFYRKSVARYKEKLAARPDLYSDVSLGILEPPEYVSLISTGKADKVFTFRNVHNWLKAGTEEAVFQAAYDALEPGGIFGVVEHRAKPGTSRGAMVKSGYVTEELVIELASKVGFQLLAKSEVNANPNDTADHPKGVWTLPPSLRLGEENKEKYLVIGESDRMTLKFMKPENHDQEN